MTLIAETINNTVKPVLPIVQNVNILLVDDMVSGLMALEAILDGLPGINILKAQSGKEALKIIENNDLAVVVSDVQMPEMDGFELLDLINQNNKIDSIPFIFVTAMGHDRKYVTKGYKGGAVDYLFKPLDQQITRAKICAFVTMYKQKQQLKQQNQQLIEINSKKNILLGMAAHDMRSPLAGISSLADFLSDEKEYGSLHENQKIFIENIKKYSLYMLNIINNLLDVSAIEAGKLNLNIQQTDIAVLLEKIIGLNKLIAQKKGIELELNIELSNKLLFIDPVKIEQVLNNFLSNAIKFSPAKTLILIKAVQKENDFYIEVTDHGQGIPEEEQKILFNAFQKTSVLATDGESSTGLGLLICSKIINSHDGTIGVKSKPKEGSTFWFSIPVNITEINADACYELPVYNKGDIFQNNIDEVTKASSKSILVAEDDALSQFVIKRVLQNLGHKVHLANNGEMAIELLEKNVLCD